MKGAFILAALFEAALLLALFAPTLFATGGVAQLTTALSSLCTTMTELLPVVAMLMVVLGAVIYASGQMMGAETRARANVWATAALTGAVMAILLVTVSPAILSSIYGPAISCGAGGGPGPAYNCPSSNPVIFCDTTNPNTNTCCLKNGVHSCTSTILCSNSGGTAQQLILPPGA
ncbi:MAG: hypothetical protein WC588_02065 [Candidatus Micrarchaeia archaeon]